MILCVYVAILAARTCAGRTLWDWRTWVVAILAASACTLVQHLVGSDITQQLARSEGGFYCQSHYQLMIRGWACTDGGWGVPFFSFGSGKDLLSLCRGSFWYLYPFYPHQIHSPIFIFFAYAICRYSADGRLRKFTGIYLLSPSLVVDLFPLAVNTMYRFVCFDLLGYVHLAWL